MAGISGNSNIGSTSRLNQAQENIRRTLERLATGRRINQASDDAAGLQISNNLRADIRVLNQGQRNASTAFGITQIADQTLGDAGSLLERAGEIAIQAASGTTSAAGRDALNAELQEIFGQLDSLGQNTNFDGEAIFGGSFSARTGESDTEQVDVNVDNLSTADLGLAGANLSTATDASNALDQIQSAISQLSSSRGEIGATQQRLTTTIEAIQARVISTQEAESQIADADVAEEVVNLTKFRILAESGVSAIAQGNQLNAQTITSLLA